MLTYGIDWDDVISDLNTHAIQLANGEHGLDLKLEDINSWENVGKASVIKQYYQDERIYRMQTVTDEARNFIHELQKGESIYYHSNRSTVYESAGKTDIDGISGFPGTEYYYGFSEVTGSF